MKRFYLSIAVVLAAGASYAQTDSTRVTIDSSRTNVDTIKIGTFIIIKKNRPNSANAITADQQPKKPSKITTNWWIFDLGFANVHDETDYGSPSAMGYLHTRPGEKAFTKDDLKLRNGKTSNVNIWIAMQRLSLYKNYVNLKYGVGLEMFNFRYDNNITYHKNPAYIFKDSVNFSKNKLFASYVSVPFMINLNTSPGRKKGLSLSAGVSAGYLVGSRNKQISDERGKVKTKGDLDLETFRLAYVGELGIGPIRLFGSYSMRTLHENGLAQYPYSFGIRFSNW